MDDVLKIIKDSFSSNETLKDIVLELQAIAESKAHLEKRAKEIKSNRINLDTMIRQSGKEALMEVIAFADISAEERSDLIKFLFSHKLSPTTRPKHKDIQGDNLNVDQDISDDEDDSLPE